MENLLEFVKIQMLLLLFSYRITYKLLSYKYYCRAEYKRRPNLREKIKTKNHHQTNPPNQPNKKTQTNGKREDLFCYSWIGQSNVPGNNPLVCTYSYIVWKSPQEMWKITRLLFCCCILKWLQEIIFFNQFLVSCKES